VSESSRPEEDLYDFLVIALRELKHDRDMSLPSAGLLSSIARRGPQRITALAAVEGISQPSMTQLVGRLEGRGLVRRTPDPEDARATLVELTDAGVEALRERRRGSSERIGTLLAALPAEQADAITGAVAAALPALRARADETDPMPA
jgi:DNA-binding MarR family transcriptional regulator